MDSAMEDGITLPVDYSLHQQQQDKVISLPEKDNEDIFLAALSDIKLIVNNSEEEADTIYYKVLIQFYGVIPLIMYLC